MKPGYVADNCSNHGYNQLIDTEWFPSFVFLTKIEFFEADSLLRSRELVNLIMTDSKISEGKCGIFFKEL